MSENTAGALLPLPSQGERRVPSFGAAATRIGVTVIDLTVARTLAEFPMTGNFLWVIASSQQSATANIRFNSQRDPDIPIGAGMSFAGPVFDRLYISNAAQAGQTLTLLYAVEHAGGFRITNPSSIIQSVSVSQPTTFLTAEGTVGTSAQLLLGAAAARREVIVNNVAANPGILYVGEDNTVTAGNGLEVLQGGTLILTGTFAVWAISNVAGNSIRLAEILD